MNNVARKLKTDERMQEKCFLLYFFFSVFLMVDAGQGPSSISNMSLDHASIVICLLLCCRYF